jgi:MORN repeat
VSDEDFQNGHVRMLFEDRIEGKFKEGTDAFILIEQGQIRLTFVDGYVLESAIIDGKIEKGNLTLPDKSKLEFTGYE